jgi:GNAT superfamily N-acetyltransferase
MKTIVKATVTSIKEIMKIYEDARAYMRATGNATQWAGGYPSEALICGDIARGNFYLCMDEGKIVGVFYFAVENDPTYANIYDGAWLNDEPYAVIHRIAVSRDSHGKGVAAFIFDSCFEKCSNLKIDTHRDNLPMQRALEKRGFVRCGIIYLANGDERVAFQRNR